MGGELQNGFRNHTYKNRCVTVSMALFFANVGVLLMADLSSVKADELLDARGLSCPMPMLKTKKRLQAMKSGQILEVFGTDPGSKNDIPAFCKRGGHELLGYEDVPAGYTRYLIKRG